MKRVKIRSKKLKVVFVSFPVLSASQVEKCFKQRPNPYWVTVPLGIAHLVSVLENEEFIDTVECVDYLIELQNGPDYGSYENFIDTLAEKITYKPDIVAYSINFSTQHDFFVRCEERFRQKWIKPKTPIKGFYLTGHDITTVGLPSALSSGVLTTSVILNTNMYKKI